MLLLEEETDVFKLLDFFFNFVHDRGIGSMLTLFYGFDAFIYVEPMHSYL